MMNELATRLHAAAIHLLRSVREVDRETGLGPARLSALSVLVFGGARTVGKLAAAEGVRPATMTPIVAWLEAAGLVRKESDARDGRRVRVVATAAGRRVMEEGRRRRLDLLQALLGEVGEEDRRVLAAGVAVLERVLAGSGAAAADAETPAAT
jgi:DNA-binding MarR family transcriptional regulator